MGYSGTKWLGNENVMDAGSGSGVTHKSINQTSSKRKVYAIDIDSNMIKQAKNNFNSLIMLR
jgi:trans-aconitate 2-methyltransferase